MISASPKIGRIDGAGMVAAPVLSPDISLHFDFYLELTNFADAERDPELHMWLSGFQEQTARTFVLKEEKGTDPRRTARQTSLMLVAAPVMPSDCCVDVDLVSSVPNPDTEGVRGSVMSGYASFYVADLLKLKEGESASAKISVGGDKYTKAVMHVTMRENPAVRCEVLHHPLLERKNLKKLFKKFKWAGISLFDNSNGNGIKPLRDVCRRTHVLSWRTRWGHLPTEFFFADNTRGCGAPTEAFFAALLEAALDARRLSRKDMLE